MADPNNPGIWDVLKTLFRAPPADPVSYPTDYNYPPAMKKQRGAQPTWAKTLMLASPMGPEPKEFLPGGAYGDSMEEQRPNRAAKGRLLKDYVRKRKKK